MLRVALGDIGDYGIPGWRTIAAPVTVTTRVIPTAGWTPIWLEGKPKDRRHIGAVMVTGPDNVPGLHAIHSHGNVVGRRTVALATGEDEAGQTTNQQF